MIRNVYLDLDAIDAALFQNSDGTRSLHLILTPQQLASLRAQLQNLNVYEFRDDLPAKMKDPSGNPRHEFLGITVFANREEFEADGNA